MLLPFLFLLDSRPTPSDRLRLTGSSLLPPVFDETLTVFRRVLSSIKSAVPRTTSPRSASRAVDCSLSKTSTLTSMYKDTLRQHLTLSPKPYRTSAYSDELVTWSHGSPLSRHRRDLVSRQGLKSSQRLQARSQFIGYSASWFVSIRQTYSSATASSTILASTTAPSASLVVTATPATILATTPSSQADARSRSVQSVRIQTAAPVTHPKSIQPQPLQHRIKLIQIVSGREVYSPPLQPYCSTSSTARTTILSGMFVASHNLFTTVRYLPEFSSSPSRRRYPYFLVIFKSRDLIRKTNTLSPMGLAHFMAVESLSRPFIRVHIAQVQNWFLTGLHGFLLYYSASGPSSLFFNVKSSHVELWFLAMRSPMVLTLEFQKLKVFSAISTLVRAISGKLQSKEIIGIVKDIRSISSGFASIYVYHFSTLPAVVAKKSSSSLLIFVMDFMSWAIFGSILYF